MHCYGDCMERSGGRGSRELRSLIAMNSLFQIFAFPLYAYLFISVLPPLFGLASGMIQVSMDDVAQSVAVYLGIPCIAGAITRKIAIYYKGNHWYDEVFMPRLAPLSLVSLLITIILMFSLSGDQVITRPLDVSLIAIPLCLYFLKCFVFLSSCRLEWALLILKR